MIKKIVVRKASQYTSHLAEMSRKGYSFKEVLSNNTPNTVILVFEKDDGE